MGLGAMAGEVSRTDNGIGEKESNHGVRFHRKRSGRASDGILDLLLRRTHPVESRETILKVGHE